MIGVAPRGDTLRGHSHYGYQASRSMTSMCGKPTWIDGVKEAAAAGKWGSRSRHSRDCLRLRLSPIWWGPFL
jgi:hypothetical protein